MVPMIIIVIVDGSGTSEIGENAAENGELSRPLPASAVPVIRRYSSEEFKCTGILKKPLIHAYLKARN
jgi:hypothetical protein